MSERKRRIFLGIGLVAAIVYALNYYVPLLSREEKTERDAAAPQSSSSPQATAAKVASAVSQIDVEKERSKSWGADPFRSRKVQIMPTKTIAAPVLPWKLSGIVLGGEKPMAIINSRGVSEGDEVDGALVISIESREVVLERSGLRFTLRVNEG